ncbi:hypothetical protein C8J55DRAFT_486271 [Lentinula edodes]|uniref:HECT domain-containing protein n=1 Tax=Lentinula lateritia TaxID=40482 RepID=A0A9W9DYF5_9AGAR|nr:hypothetical protein C8J55DRAFT_486271 [Lentinula edodes]
MDGNPSDSSTSNDQITRLLQSFLATSNAQALMGQNQYSPMLQSLLISQALSQNLPPNQATTFQGLSSAPSSLPQMGASLPNSHPVSGASQPIPTPPSSASQPAQILPSPQLSQQPQVQVPPGTQSQTPSVSAPYLQAQPLPPSSSQHLIASSSLHQTPASQSNLGSSNMRQPSSFPASIQQNIEPQPLFQYIQSAEPMQMYRNSQTSPEGPSLPPPPPSCRPYTSMQASTGATDGYGQLVGLQGRSRVTTAPGFPGLTAIQRTNHTRLDHASQSLPQNPRREKKLRGKAVRPPALARRDRGLSIEDCINVATGGVEVHYRLPNQPVFYEINKDAFQMVLNALGLSHQYPNLPISTTVFDLLSDITTKLRERYNLRSVSSSIPLSPQEHLPLQLLGFSNHGRSNGSYGTSKLRLMPYERNMTIRDLLSSNSTFAIPRLVITRENHFQLHTIIRNYPLEANVNLAQAYLGMDDSIRPHRCLSKRLYIMFRHDSDANLNVAALDEEEIEESCDELNDSDDDDDEDTRVIAQSLIAEPESDNHVSSTSNVSQSIPSISSENGISLSSTRESNSTSTPPSTNSPVLNPRSSTQTLWKERWTSPVRLDSIPEFFDHERSQIFDIVAKVDREGDCPGFQVKGTDEQELASDFIKLMKISVRSQDWSRVLSPFRHFVQVNNQDDYISSGPGCEQSTMSQIFHQFFDSREDDFCTPLYEGYTTLQSADLQISPEKHDELVLFGAVTALALVYGRYPGRLNPLLLIYLLNDCNLSCLHRDLVSSYLPSFSTMLDRWLNIRSTDSAIDFASHFASYHNLQVGVLNGRSEVGHQALAWEMLHNVVVGSVGIDNAYFAAFIKGFRLPCSTGITLVNIVRSFSGGAEEFVRTAEASTIKDLASLDIRITCSIGDQSSEELSNAFNIAGPPFAGNIFEDAFKDFLTGIGAPCPQQLENIRNQFAPEVQSSLSGLHSPTFRMRVTCWAVTGATHILRDGGAMRIILVEDRDPLYLPATVDPDLRQAYCLSGTCSFKTCTRTMRIPVSYLIQLLTKTYDPNTEPKDAYAAFNNWLLIQILGSCGAYTTV